MISQFGVPNEVIGAEATVYNQGAVMDQQYDMDPVDLFTDLGLLVLESRRPHQSAKGRVESPHCPLSNWKSHVNHVCSIEDPQCKEKEAVKSYIQFLYRNAIPLSIEVMLYPECCYQEHQRVEIGAVSEAGSSWHGDQHSALTEANSHLLEQWIVQLLPKRFADGLSEPHLLLQAVRSFLCFSQISSWLSSTQGRSPYNLVYRVCAPDESFGGNFAVEPKIHTFPVVNISKTSSIKVSVAHTPRQMHIPRIPCPVDHTRLEKLQHLSHLGKPSERDGTGRKYGGGHHLRNIDSQSSSSDESANDDKRGAKSKKVPSVDKCRIPQSVCDESPYFRTPKRDLSQYPDDEDFPVSIRDDLTADHLYLHSPILSSSDRLMSKRETDDWPPDSLGTPLDILTSGVSSENEKLQYPYLDDHSFTPSPPVGSKDRFNTPTSPLQSPLLPGKDVQTPSSPVSWEQSLSDLEHKYSALNLDDIPRTECSSFESDQVNYDSQRESFELGRFDASSVGNEDSVDNEIVFAAEEESLNGLQSLSLSSWDPDSTFNPLSLDHRIRTVSDSETCSLSVRLPDILGSASRNVQSSSVSSSSACKDPSTSDFQGRDVMRNPVSLSRKSLTSLESEASIPTPKGAATSKPALLKNVLSKSTHHVPNKPRGVLSNTTAIHTPKKHRKTLDHSGAYIFNPCTGLPINSSPALLRKAQTTADCTSLLPSLGHMKSSPSCNNLEQPAQSTLSQATRVLSTSAPAATSCLLGNFEESVLNGRLEPLGTLQGFTAEVGASGSFCPKHVTFPVTVYFFSVADEDAPSSYYGHINLEQLGKRGYRIPKTGTIQVILFNPNKTVVKMFVMRYNLSEMPPNSQTFARQRIFYMPSNADPDDESEKQLRYLLHLRFQSSSSGKIYLHTDVRLIFARHCPDLESSLGTYELRSFTEFPTDPRFSPKK